MKFKKKVILPLVIIIFLVTTGFSPVANEKVNSNTANEIENLEVHINSANVVLEENSKNSFDIFTYGTLDQTDYIITTNKESKTKIISFKGNKKGSWLEKEGVLLKVPSIIKNIDIITDGAGMHINDIDISLDLKTKASTINILNENQNKTITINSNTDSYFINLGIPKADIEIKEKYSSIDLYLSKNIKNVSIDITNKLGGLIDLPKNWKKNIKLEQETPQLN